MAGKLQKAQKKAKKNLTQRRKAAKERQSTE
jgi:hypothetical protein